MFKRVLLMPVRIGMALGLIFLVGCGLGPIMASLSGPVGIYTVDTPVTLTATGDGAVVIYEFTASGSPPCGTFSPATIGPTVERTVTTTFTPIASTVGLLCELKVTVTRTATGETATASIGRQIRPGFTFTPSTATFPHQIIAKGARARSGSVVGDSADILGALTNTTGSDITGNLTAILVRQVSGPGGPLVDGVDIALEWGTTPGACTTFAPLSSVGTITFAGNTYLEYTLGPPGGFTLPPGPQPGTCIRSTYLRVTPDFGPPATIETLVFTYNDSNNNHRYDAGEAMRTLAGGPITITFTLVAIAP